MSIVFPYAEVLGREELPVGTLVSCSPFFDKKYTHIKTTTTTLSPTPVASVFKGEMKVQEHSKTEGGKAVKVNHAWYTRNQLLIKGVDYE